MDGGNMFVQVDKGPVNVVKKAPWRLQFKPYVVQGLAIVSLTWKMVIFSNQIFVVVVLNIFPRQQRSPSFVFSFPLVAKRRIMKH